MLLFLEGHSPLSYFWGRLDDLFFSFSIHWACMVSAQRLKQQIGSTPQDFQRIWALHLHPKKGQGCLAKTLISHRSSDNPATRMVPEQNLTRAWQSSTHCSKDRVKAFIHPDFSRYLSLAIAASNIFMLAFLVKNTAIYCYHFFCYECWIFAPSRDTVWL